MKQTAVEYLVERLEEGINEEYTWHKVIEQAKSIEEKQIRKAYSTGYNESSWGRFSDSEKYYNETFKQQDNDTRTKHD